MVSLWVVGVYMPPNYYPSVVRVKQALGNTSKGVEVILMVDLNMRLQEPRDAWEEELLTVVAFCGLDEMTEDFMPRRRYRGDGRWTWRMRS